MSTLSDRSNSLLSTKKAMDFINLQVLADITTQHYIHCCIFVSNQPNLESLLNLPTIITLPKITDPRGNLTFLEFPGVLPFELQRIFWTYDVPGGEMRGGHAYRSQQEVIIAISGSFDVIVTDVHDKKTAFQLNRSYYGLYLPAGTWRHMENFSTNSLSLHLSSSEYNEGDYIRDVNEFKKIFS